MAGGRPRILSCSGLLAAIALPAAIACLATTAFSQPRPMATRVFNDVGIEQRLGAQLPLDLRFTDEQGKSVPLSSYFGKKPVVLSLVYYKCQMLCPQVLEGMTGTFRTLEDMNIGREFTVVSVSFDHREGPADAVKRKEKYVRDYSRDGADENWHFLTGDSASIKRLADSVGFLYLYDDKTKQFAHASGIIIATPDGKLSRYLYGIEYQADDLRFSLMEASHEKIGRMVDKLLLLCYHYDPESGTYGLVVINLLRAGGVLAVLALAGYILLNYLRDRRKMKLAATSGGGGR